MITKMNYYVVFSFIAVLSIASSAAQESIDENSRNNYSVEASFSALILKPGASNLHYAAEALPLPVPTPNWNIYDLNPRYHFGFELGFKVIGHKNDCFFMINWEHFKSSTSAHLSVPTTDMVGPFFEIGPDASPYSIAAGHTQFDFNQVDIDIGQNICSIHRLQTSFFGGIGVVSIRQCLNQDYSNTSGDIFRSIVTPLNFMGAGPQFGVEFAYDICYGFYIAGKGLCSLFSGTLKNHTHYSSISPALQAVSVTPPNRQNTYVKNRSAVIPALREKLGIAYAFTVNKCFLQIEAGYQSQIYISALQSVDIGSEVVTPPVTPDTIGVYARTFQRNVSNFSLAGPYVTIDLSF